jgi:Co/Zn/Cd efflux system component
MNDCCEIREVPREQRRVLHIVLWINVAMFLVESIAGILGHVGLLAFAANLFCLILLWRRRGDDINMRSAWVCSRNDIVGNAGVLVAAALVALTGSPWPDVVIGLLVAAVFVHSAVRVIQEASGAVALPH